MESQTKKCLKCGQNVLMNTNYCPNCGRSEFDIEDNNVTQELTPEESPWLMQNDKTSFGMADSDMETKKTIFSKKILSAIIVGVAVLVFGTLFSNILKSNSGSEAPKVEYTKGEVVGNSYFNEWADISIVFPTTYSNASEDMYAASENDTTDCCMYFVELSGGNIMILAEEISHASFLTEKSYIDNTIKSLDENMASAYFPYETSVTILSENKTVEIAGYTYYQLSYQIDLSLDPMYISVLQNMYLRKIGNRMLAIVTTTNTVEQADELIGLIAKYEENEISTEITNLDKEYEPSPELSNDIDSFQVQVLDVVYQFPMNYDDFVATGWRVYEKYDSVDEEIQSGFDTLVWFEKDGMLMNCSVFNPDISVQSIDGCVISGIAEVDSSRNKDKNFCVFIPGGFKVGEASKADVLAAFREPDTVYEGDTMSIITFETDNVYASTELSFDANGILCDITVENPIPTENYEYSSADTSYVPDYTVPTSMGSKITDRIVNFDGDLYQLPVTVNALIENGWTTVDLHETVRGDGIYFVDMERNGISFHTTVYNYSGNAVEVVQCYIQELRSQDVYGKQFEISGGIHMQMTEDELKTILDNEGLEYTTKTYDDGIGYGFYIGEDTWENFVNLRFTDGKVQYMTICAGKEWRE